jgi:hypothetical protein
VSRLSITQEEEEREEQPLSAQSDTSAATRPSPSNGIRSTLFGGGSRLREERYLREVKKSASERSLKSLVSNTSYASRGNSPQPPLEPLPDIDGQEPDSPPLSPRKHEESEEGHRDEDHEPALSPLQLNRISAVLVDIEQELSKTHRRLAHPSDPPSPVEEREPKTSQSSASGQDTTYTTTSTYNLHSRAFDSNPSTGLVAESDTDEIDPRIAHLPRSVSCSRLDMAERNSGDPSDVEYVDAREETPVGWQSRSRTPANPAGQIAAPPSESLANLLTHPLSQSVSHEGSFAGNESEGQSPVPTSYRFAFPSVPSRMTDDAASSDRGSTELPWAKKARGASAMSVEMGLSPTLQSEATSTMTPTVGVPSWAPSRASEALSERTEEGREQYDSEQEERGTLEGRTREDGERRFSDASSWHSSVMGDVDDDDWLEGKGRQSKESASDDSPVVPGPFSAFHKRSSADQVTIHNQMDGPMDRRGWPVLPCRTSSSSSKRWLSRRCSALLPAAVPTPSLARHRLCPLRRHRQSQPCRKPCI